jgi:hypothetical protein
MNWKELNQYLHEMKLDRLIYYSDIKNRELYPISFATTINGLIFLNYTISKISKSKNDKS